MNRQPTGDKLFTFVVVADTHVNQAEDYSSSPYPCNQLANARTRRVVAEINEIDPVLVLHLGDIVNPVPELPAYQEAAGHFKELVSDLKPPLHLVPGNHDIGDKNVSWVPAGIVSDKHLELYESHFGPHYYSFDDQGVHFVVVNSPIINSGLRAEAEQREWLQRDLAANEGKRIFVCIHHPPYVSRPEESDSYDNIDEPGRTWLLELLRRYRPEALFCGHVHNFWYDLFADTDIYILPSTAFVRHDYSEFFRVGPADQNGRNDEAKLGYFVVDVHKSGHVARNVRSYGRVLAPGENVAEQKPRLPAVHSRREGLPRVGIDLRHPWAEEIEVPPSGALDEFERKRARNDYPLLALWETGLRHLRVPLQDLLDTRVRERMQKLKSLGHSFQIYCYAAPQPRAQELIKRYASLIDVLELVVDWSQAHSQLEWLRSLKRTASIRVFVSRVNRKDGAKESAGRYNHLISVGFNLDEAHDLAELKGAMEGLIDGYVFRVPREACPAHYAEQASALATRLGVVASLYVRSSGSSPAETFDDDLANAKRIAVSIVSASQRGNVEMILDTFTDSDRGYFARNGLVDRRYNPRLTSHVVSNLCALINDNRLSRIELIDSQTAFDGMPGDRRCYDLVSGEIVDEGAADISERVLASVEGTAT